MMALTAVLGIAAATSTGCGSAGDSDGKVSVVASFYPLEYFSVRIGGDRVRVINLVKPGVEPHDFEPSSDDLKTIAAADVLVYNGLGFEPWLERAIASTGDARTVLVAAGEAVSASDRLEGVDEDGDAGIDPHVWLDPRHAVREAEAIRDALKKADPGGADSYDRNAARLIDDLNGIDRRFSETLTRCRLDRFVTAHEAFGYLALRYGLEQIGVTGIEQEEPNPQALADIAKTVRESGVRVVLTEPGASPRIAETLAREAGTRLGTLDPLEFAPDEGDFLAAMERNASALRDALECGG
jgi:zinc transport system substrate-binding protein